MRFLALKSRSSRPTERVIGGILALGLAMMLAALAAAQPMSAVPPVQLAGGVTSIPYEDPIGRPRPVPREPESLAWGWDAATLLYVLAYLAVNALLTYYAYAEGYKRGERSVKKAKWEDVEQAITSSFEARFKEAKPYLPADVYLETEKVILRARDTVSADVKKVFDKIG